MTISDERFELNMQGLEADDLPGTAAELRARDTAQREAIERLQGELDEYISSVPGIENPRDNLREALARVEAERAELWRQHREAAGELVLVQAVRAQIQEDRDTAQAQLAEAVERLAKAEETIARLQSGAVT